MYSFEQLLLESSEVFDFLRFTWTYLPAPVRLSISISFGGMIFIFMIMMFRR